MLPHARAHAPDHSGQSDSKQARRRCCCCCLSYLLPEQLLRNGKDMGNVCPVLIWNTITQSRLGCYTAEPPLLVCSLPSLSATMRGGVMILYKPPV